MYLEDEREHGAGQDGAVAGEPGAARHLRIDPAPNHLRYPALHQGEYIMWKELRTGTATRMSEAFFLSLRKNAKENAAELFLLLANLQ